MTRRIINKYSVAKVKAHQHEYVQHPNPDWATHYCCRICGMAVPKSIIDNSLVYSTLVVRGE